MFPVRPQSRWPLLRPVESFETAVEFQRRIFDRPEYEFAGCSVRGAAFAVDHVRALFRDDSIYKYDTDDLCLRCYMFLKTSDYAVGLQ